MNQIDTLPALRVSELALLPCHKWVLDRLTDVLLDADELLEIVRTAEPRQRSWLEPRLRRIFDDVDDLMKRLD